MILRYTRRLFVIILLDALVCCGQSARYLELRRVIDRNTGFAHMTRGVNMYTLYALRSCVSGRDVGVLREMLRDKDRITRMATSAVLVDLGAEGMRVVQARLAEVTDASEKLMLKESIETASKPDYRPILQYPLSDSERARIHGCQ
jgi:hypothetical protein